MDRVIETLQELERGIWNKEILLTDKTQANWYRQGYEDAMRHAIKEIRSFENEYH